VWGVIPDFWSISGSGLILGGAIWVAIAKSRIKRQRNEDLEPSGYVRVNGEEQNRKPTELDLGEMSEDEGEPRHTSCSSSSPRTESSPQAKEKEGCEDIVDREIEDLNIADHGELTEVINWSEAGKA
jgi:hypothetical protein